MAREETKGGGESSIVKKTVDRGRKGERGEEGGRDAGGGVVSER